MTLFLAACESGGGVQAKRVVASPHRFVDSSRLPTAIAEVARSADLICLCAVEEDGGIARMRLQETWRWNPSAAPLAKGAIVIAESGQPRPADTDAQAQILLFIYMNWATGQIAHYESFPVYHGELSAAGRSLDDLRKLLLGTSASLTMDSVLTLSHERVEAQLAEAEGVIYYGYAGRLFKEGRKVDAVFWFYVGQLRFRVELQAHPDQDPSAGPALFGAMQEELGTLINGWAGGDVQMWVAQIDRALAWDLANPNGVISKSEFEAIYKEQRAGLLKLRAQLVSQADEIRKDRKSQGLENRSIQPPDLVPPAGTSPLSP